MSVARKQAGDSEASYEDVPVVAGTLDRPQRDQAAPWFRWFTSEWSIATRALKPAERGVLADLLTLMHETRGPVVEDIQLARWCAEKPKKLAATIEVLIQRRAIFRTAVGLWSTWIEREVENQANRTQNARKNVSRRYEKTQQNQSSKSTDVGKMTRDKREEMGSSIPSSSPSSSSTLDVSQRSTMKVAGDAPDSASRDLSKTDLRRHNFKQNQDIEIPELGMCSVESVKANGMVVRVHASGEYHAIHADGTIEQFEQGPSDENQTEDDDVLF